MTNVNFKIFPCSFFLLLTLVFTTSAMAAYCGDKEYDIAKIPASLKKDINAVVRKNVLRFEVKDKQTAVEKVTKAVTVFNKDGRDNGELSISYDRFTKIEELEGKIFDASGEEVRELEDGDIKDVSAYNDFSLYEDSRLRHASLYYDKYPYTVEFTYKISYDGYLGWPSWYSRLTIDPVINNRFEVIIPSDYKLRYWTNQDSLKPFITIDGSKKLYCWEAQNLPQLSKDAIGEDIEDVAAIVRIAPADFEIEGYKGSMASWKEFGQWYFDLYNGKDQLPAKAIEEINNIYSPSDNELEKIEKLYRYMQSHTRYVSIQLGIGGWQPFDAKSVHENGYGDCKALSNYMAAILKEAGIQAYPALINNGSHRLPIINEFPSHQFNHVLCCVPLQKDTIWLECTSQSVPAGHIGWGNENRSALLITENGGVLIPTPRSKCEENLQVRKARALIKSIGDVDVSSNIIWNGNQMGQVRSRLDEATPEECQKWVINNMDVPDSRLQQFKFEGIENKSPVISLQLQSALPNYASVSGNRIFFKPNMMEKRTSVPKDVPLRLSPVRFVYPYHDIDSVYYTMPSGFTIEALPKETKLSSSFAEFNSKTIVIDDTSILFIRSLEVKEYSVAAKNYTEYRKFFSDVVKADRAQVVLIRK